VQIGFAVNALLIKVTAPLRAHQVPWLLAALLAAIEVYEIILPFMALAPPIVAEDPLMM
jgi:hypothetical protein